jgi:hypothetical protein
MKITLLCSVLIVACSYASGQNLVGYNNTEIRKFMKENRKDMHFNKVKNSMFSYLKYTDNTDSQTILFFLTNDSICKGVRVICDNSLSREKLQELDKNYKRIGENKWIDNHNGQSYLIRFKKEEWSCSITIEPEI